MENEVMLKNGKYKNRLIDAFVSVFIFDNKEFKNVDENIISDYILKHINDDVPNCYLLASNIGLDMEKNGLCSTDKLRNNVVVGCILSEQEPYKTIFGYVEKIRNSYNLEISMNYKVPKNVLTYFEDQLVKKILLQYVRLALKNDSKCKCVKIKITSKTSDMLYGEYEDNSLQRLKLNIIEYFLFYHHLSNFIEIIDFVDYLIISIKDPFERIIY